MPQILRNSGLSANDLVTNTKLHNLVDTAVITKELITAQTTLPEVEGGAFLLTYSPTADALRKISIENILSDLSYDNLLIGNYGGTTEIRGKVNIYDKLSTDPEVVYGGIEIDFTNDIAMSAVRVQGGLSVENVLVDGVVSSKTTALDTSRIEFGSRMKLEDNKMYDSEIANWGDKYTLTIGGGPLGGDNDNFKTIFGANSKVEFLCPPRLASGIIYIGEEKEDPEDEVTVDISTFNKGVYDYLITEVSQAFWLSTSGDVRRQPSDVPTVGKILVDDEFVIPANETWVIQYTGSVYDVTDDNFTLVWQTVEDNVSTDVKTFQFDTGQGSFSQIGWYFSLSGGTDGRVVKIRLRGAVNAGTGTDAFYVFYSGTNGAFYERTRKVTKIRI